MTRITVAGFKSIREEQSIEIRPLTILAGANSSGKSSIIQPLLLMKQTLEATYDPPDPLLLDGPNVKFSSADQFLCRLTNRSRSNIFTVGIEYASLETVTTHYAKNPTDGYLEIPQMDVAVKGLKAFTSLRPGLDSRRILDIYPYWTRKRWSKLLRDVPELALWVGRYRCFLSVFLGMRGGRATSEGIEEFPTPLRYDVSRKLSKMIHLPGLRGNPERVYPRTSFGPDFPGTFSPYVATVVSDWQSRKDAKFSSLEEQLVKLGLTSRLKALQVSDIHVELHVTRPKTTSRAGAGDFVSIADVGVGVSQALPVVVALVAAEPEQLVYIEQPEIHLHPRAQMAMAEVLADAAKRGVRVVAETHSSLLLLAIQTLVAQGKLPPELVKLHWFKLNKKGFTEITSTDLDEAGRFDSDWPEDFGEVELNAERHFLNASEKHLMGH